MISLNLPNSTAVVSEITSDSNIIGTASPREILFLCFSLLIAVILGIILAHYLKIRLSHRLKKDQITILSRGIFTILIIIAIGISVPALLDLSITLIIILVVGIIAIIGFSSQNVIANMVSGLALIYENPFTTGDFISTGDVSGTVVSVRLLSIRVRTTSGVYVHIPNEKIYSTNVSNYFANVARRFEFTIGIRYEDDVNRAIAIINEMLDAYPYVLKHPAPEVFVSEIDADSVRITFRSWFPAVWQKTTDDVALATTILPRVKQALESAGIEMPYSQRVVHLVNQPTLASESKITKN
jgi:small-conductance mechanosensitive channel